MVDKCLLRDSPCKNIIQEVFFFEVHTCALFKIGHGPGFLSLLNCTLGELFDAVSVGQTVDPLPPNGSSHFTGSSYGSSSSLLLSVGAADDRVPLPGRRGGGRVQGGQLGQGPRGHRGQGRRRRRLPGLAQEARQRQEEDQESQVG